MAAAFSWGEEGLEEGLAGVVGGVVLVDEEDELPGNEGAFAGEPFEALGGQVDGHALALDGLGRATAAFGGCGHGKSPDSGTFC